MCTHMILTIGCMLLYYLGIYVVSNQIIIYIYTRFLPMPIKLDGINRLKFYTEPLYNDQAQFDSKITLG